MARLMDVSEMRIPDWRSPGGFLRLLSAAAWLALALAMTVATIVTARDLHRFLNDADKSMVEVTRTARSVAGYAEFQTATLRDPKNQKALEASLQTLAVFNGTGRLINTQVVPRVMRGLEDLDGTVRSLDVLVKGLDRNVNGGLLPALTETAKALGTSVASIERAVELVAGKSGATIDDLHALMSDPAWHAALVAVQGSAENVQGTTASIDMAAKQMPSIAASMERIAATSSKYGKALLLARLLQIVVTTFF